MQALQVTIHKFPTTIICGTQEFVSTFEWQHHVASHEYSCCNLQIKELQESFVTSFIYLLEHAFEVLERWPISKLWHYKLRLGEFEFGTNDFILHSI
jgi:hypothetical protein